MRIAALRWPRPRRPSDSGHPEGGVCIGLDQGTCPVWRVPGEVSQPLARGHDVHVMGPRTTHREHGTFTEVIEGEPMTMPRHSSWRWYPRDWLTFVMPFRSKHDAPRVLDEVQPDVVHIQSHIVIDRGLSREAARCSQTSPRLLPRSPNSPS